MAFTFTKDNDSVAGDLRLTSGTFTSAGGSTGGDIRTGLQQVLGMVLQQKGSAVVASAPKVNESFPAVDGITIVSAANAAGWWMAWRY